MRSENKIEMHMAQSYNTFLPSTGSHFLQLGKFQQALKKNVWHQPFPYIHLT